MRDRVKFLIMILLIASATGGGWRYLSTHPTARDQLLSKLDLQTVTAEGLLTASGFVEVDEVNISTELGSRVVGLLVDEGNEVEAGQVLVRLDGTLLEAQIEVAQAAVDVAQAQLAQIRAGTRPEQIRQAEAVLAQAKAARDGAHQAWQDAIAIRDEPQELDAQIVLARTEVAAAEVSRARAIALKDAAEIANDRHEDAMHDLKEATAKLRELPKEQRLRLPGMQLDTHLIPNQYWKSWVAVSTAQAALDAAGASLNSLYAMRSNPQALNAQVDAAEAQYNATEAAVQEIQAQLEALQAGATEEEIAVVEAQVTQAQAALASLTVLRDKLTATAPVGGLVLERSIRAGELAVPGVTLLTLGDLDQVTLEVYVPEDRLGQVLIGQQVEVRVDSFPEHTFQGRVVAIASKAEFTPRNVQTAEERVNLVFAVDLSIPNPNHLLKPGMPADAIFALQEQEK
jgi:HlyD family secretion protein